MSEVEPGPFKLKGVMSMRDACLIVFRGLPVRGWISVPELVAQVCDLTEAECDETSVRRAAWDAQEVLASGCEGGVGWHMGGYQRLDADGKAEAVNDQLRWARNRLARVAWRIGDALADPELSQDQRRKMQDVQRADLMRQWIEDAPKRRRRPLPPGGDQPE